MKITLQQLEQHLAKNLAPIYIVSSDELLLVQEAVETIRHTAQNAGYSERTAISADPNSDWSKSLYSSTHSMSLFSQKQIIELNLHQAKFSANTTKALQEYAIKPQADAILVIRTNKVDAKTEKSAWFQALEKNSVFLPIWPINATQLPPWITQRAKKLGLSLAKDSAELIANQAEGNLLAAAQEIEKLHLLSLSNTKITYDNFDNARFDVFDLVESVLSGNKTRSIRILKNLKEEDAEPPLVLWALTREFRMLADMLNQLKQGNTLNALFPKFHIYEKRQPSVRAFLQRHPLEKCWDFLLKAAHIDRMVKGAEKGNIWDEMEQLILLAA